MKREKVREAWTKVQQWELRNHKRLFGYRLIVLYENRWSRKIWLPGTGLDDQILAAFRSRMLERQCCR